MVHTARLLHRLLTILLVSSVAAVPAAAAAPPAHPTLGQPFDVLALPNGHLVVTDLTANAVYELDPARGTGRMLAAVREARELERLPDGRLLVTSRNRVLALDARTGTVKPFLTAQAYLLGIALSPDGWLYASENRPGSEQTTVVRLRRGRREVLVRNLRGVHGILSMPGGLVLGEAYAGRVLRLDPASRAVSVLASGLGNPGFALPAGAGGWFVSEFTGNRISHVWPDGRVTKVADVFQPGPIAFDAKHRIVGVTLTGTVFRITAGRAQTIYS